MPLSFPENTTASLLLTAEAFKEYIVTNSVYLSHTPSQSHPSHSIYHSLLTWRPLWVELRPFKRYVAALVLVNVTLLGNSVFADVINLR